MAINFDSQILSLFAGSVVSDAAYQSPGTYNIPANFLGGTLASITVSNAGSGYTDRPAIGFSGGGGSGAAATAVLTGTSVASISVAAAGTGYTSIPTVSLAGFGGTGATATARMKAQTVAIQAAGSGYAQNDTITLTGGTSTQAVILTVNTVGGGGEVQAVTITNAGNYSVLPSNPVSQGSTSGGGTGATFNITAWNIVAFTVGAGGSGYTGRPTVTVTGGGGSGGAGTAVLTGTTIASITLTAAGSNYHSPPTVSVTGGAGSNGAATAVMTSRAEQRILTIVELVRAYMATISGPAEAKTFREVMLKMLDELKLGGSGKQYFTDATYPASTQATAAQAAALRAFAKMNRTASL